MILKPISMWVSWGGCNCAIAITINLSYWLKIGKDILMAQIGLVTVCHQRIWWSNAKGYPNIFIQLSSFSMNLWSVGMNLHFLAVFFFVFFWSLCFPLFICVPGLRLRNWIEALIFPFQVVRLSVKAGIYLYLVAHDGTWWYWLESIEKNAGPI